MIKVELLVGVVVFAIWLFALIEVLGTPEGAMRQLPKIGWIIVVVVFGILGALAWYVLGRPESRGPRTLGRYERATPHFPEYDRPGRAAATTPDDDDAFLQQVRARAEEQRKAYEAQKKAEKQAQEEPPTEA